MIPIPSLIDDAKCFEPVRAVRWPNGGCGPRGERVASTQQGRDAAQPERQRYLCQSCERRFDALTDPLLAGPPQPLRVWILWL
jgi:transposase